MCGIHEEVQCLPHSRRQLDIVAGCCRASDREAVDLTPKGSLQTSRSRRDRPHLVLIREGRDEKATQACVQGFRDDGVVV